jgi:hypothetical protein
LPGTRFPPVGAVTRIYVELSTAGAFVVFVPVVPDAGVFVVPVVVEPAVSTDAESNFSISAATARPKSATSAKTSASRFDSEELLTCADAKLTPPKRTMTAPAITKNFFIYV